MKNFTMAESDSINDVANASKLAFIAAMKDVINEIKNDQPQAKGLTWSQIDFLLNLFETKQPTIIEQKEEM